MEYAPTSPGETSAPAAGTALSAMGVSLPAVNVIPASNPRPSAARPQDPHHRLSRSSPSPAAKAPHRPHLRRSPLRQGPAQRRPRRSRATATALGLTDSFLPDGGRTAPSSRSGGAPGAISTSTSDRRRAAHPRIPHRPVHRLSISGARQLQLPDPDLAKIWEISWRTARLDAHETYMDTPYYEQLQYVGDTRIQALISYAVAGDDRLARQALQRLRLVPHPRGITRSRYPSSLPQSIPTFSLLYVGMLHDYWMYRPDPMDSRARWCPERARPELVRQLRAARRPAPRTALVELHRLGLRGRRSPPTTNGESCVTTLEYLGALNDAADLENALGDPALATRYQSRAAHVRTGLYDKCWSASRGLLADTPDQKGFSQQANILGVLYDVIPKDRQQDVLRQMLPSIPAQPDGVLSASYYFRFYLARALDHAGMADDLSRLHRPWRKLLPCTSAPGLKSPATPAPTPTHGAPTPSTTSSPWSPASSPPAPASPPSASRRTSASWIRSRPPIPIRRERSRSSTTPQPRILTRESREATFTPTSPSPAP
jgi:hypothetical protein